MEALVVEELAEVLLPLEVQETHLQQIHLKEITALLV
jgi:hypothetical protein